MREVANPVSQTRKQRPREAMWLSHVANPGPEPGLCSPRPLLFAQVHLQSSLAAWGASPHSILEPAFPSLFVSLSLQHIRLPSLCLLLVPRPRCFHWTSPVSSLSACKRLCRCLVLPVHLCPCFSFSVPGLLHARVTSVMSVIPQGLERVCVILSS